MVISFVSYPPESGKEIGKRFLELSPMPILTFGLT